MLALARLEAQEAVPVLRRYLHIPPGKVPGDLPSFFAGRAIEALGVLGTREAVGDLVPLLDSRDSHLRRVAQIALARIGEPETIDAVLRSLKQLPRGWHVEVLTELARVSDPNTFERLSQIELPPINSAPVAEYLRQLTETSGVKFALSERTSLPQEMQRRTISRLSGPTPMAALTRVVETLNRSSADYAVFVENATVRVVPVEEAFDLWQKWLAQHAVNHAEPAS